MECIVSQSSRGSFCCDEQRHIRSMESPTGVSLFLEGWDALFIGSLNALVYELKVWDLMNLFYRCGWPFRIARGWCILLCRTLLLVGKFTGFRLVISPVLLASQISLDTGHTLNVPWCKRGNSLIRRDLSLSTPSSILYLGVEPLGPVLGSS